MQFNPANERIKHRYFWHLRRAKRLDEQTVDANAKAVQRYEKFTGWRDFAQFRWEDAEAFRASFLEERNKKGQALSRSTFVSTLNALKRFFSWLSEQKGYRKRLRPEWVDYFNPSLKDVAIARAHRQPLVPSLEQILRLINSIPIDDPLRMRARALFALIALTGARDAAVASLRIKHLDLAGRELFQDAREVSTKFAKTIRTWFFPVGGEFERVMQEWFDYLRNTMQFGPDDPLFPATDSGFTSSGMKYALGRKAWKSASPIRRIFKEELEAAGMPYFNPHSFRHMLIRLGQQVCKTPEEFKAWSQNLGHDDVLMTFRSYGEVDQHRQRELILGNWETTDDELALDLGRDMLAKIRNAKKGG